MELLFANRQEKDILWKQQLDELAESAGQNLETYSSSELSPQWTTFVNLTFINLKFLWELLLAHRRVIFSEFSDFLKIPFFACRFQEFYSVSQPTPEWDGYEGRVSMEMLLEILPPPLSAGHERELLIAVCGLDAFTQHMIRWEA